MECRLGTHRQRRHRRGASGWSLLNQEDDWDTFGRRTPPPMRSLQHCSRHTPLHRPAPVFSRSTSPQSSLAFTPMSFMPVVQAKLRIGAPNDTSSRKPIVSPIRLCGCLIQNRRSRFSRCSDMAQRSGPASCDWGRDTRGDARIGDGSQPLRGPSAHSSSPASVATSVTCVCMQMRPARETLNPSTRAVHLGKGYSVRCRAISAGHE